jgi:hypothetical protein
MNGIEESLNM